MKVSSLRSLDDAIRAAYDLEPTVKSFRGGSVSKGPVIQKSYPEGPSKAKTTAPSSRPDQLDPTMRRMREEGKCFFCKKP